jgi:ABC-type protease/lipase transport system fused ATPase/permease subunit
VLYLTGSFFMLAVYDRVLPSRSLPTLVALALLAFGLYLFQAVLDVLRGRVLVRIGSALDEALSGRIYDMIVRRPLKARTSGDGLQPLRDIDQVRGLSLGARSDGAVRPAMDAVLPRHLLPVPSADRTDRASGVACADDARPAH